MNALNSIEIPLLDWIQEVLQCDFLDAVMPQITKLGDHGYFWIAVALVLICIPKTRKLGLMLGGAYILGGVFGNLLLKNLTARIRPYDMPFGMYAIDQILVPALSDYSFPSGHTLICVEAATVLMLKARKPWGILASVAAVLVMFSRLYLYVHYPSDVLVGAILGCLFGFLSVKYVGLWYDKALEKIAEIKKEWNPNGF